MPSHICRPCFGFVEANLKRFEYCYSRFKFN